MMEFDITLELERIIVEYDMDSSYPEYRKFLEAEKVIRDIADRFNDDANVIIVCSDYFDAVMFSSSMNRSRKWTSNKIQIKGVKDLVGYKSSFTNSEVIFIVSYNSYHEIKFEIESMGIQKEKIVGLYDLFLEKGLVIEHNYYDYRTLRNTNYLRVVVQHHRKYFERTAYGDLFFDRNEYRSADSKLLQQYYLKKIIFDCLDMRDFVYASKYMTEYIEKQFEGAEKVSAAFQKIEELFKKVRSLLLSDDNHSIAAVWVDTISFKEYQEKMPWLSGVPGVDFKSAYTVTPWTHATMTTIFTKQTQMNDNNWEVEELNLNNSPLLHLLNAQGYEFLFCAIGGPAPFYKREMLDSCFAYGYYSEPSRILWNGLRRIVCDLCSGKKTLVLSHMLNSTHSPCFTSAEEAEYYFGYSPKSEMNGVKYTDRLLQFYSSLFTENTAQIYFSDHGRAEKLSGLNFALGERFHIFCKVISARYLESNITKPFSLLNFSELVEQIIRNGNLSEPPVTSEYVTFEDAAPYSVGFVAANIHAASSATGVDCRIGLGLRGIANEDGIYFRYSNGRELCFSLTQEKSITESTFEILRNRVKADFIDIYSKDKFFYARLYEEALTNYLKRNAEYERNKNILILELFESLLREYPKERIAILSGGLQAFSLIAALPFKTASQINHLISENRDCAMSLLGFHITRAEDAAGKFDVIVSPLHDGAQTKQYKTLNNEIYVIDIYQYLEAKGILCPTEFYKYRFDECDLPREVFTLPEIKNAVLERGTKWFFG